MFRMRRRWHTHRSHGGILPQPTYTPLTVLKKFGNIAMGYDFSHSWGKDNILTILLVIEAVQATVRQRTRCL